MSIRFKTAYYT